MEKLKISQRNFNFIVKKAVKTIKQGGILICPTDTVYGLIANAKNKKAVKKIFEIKKRPLKKPMPVFVKNLKMAKNLAKIDKNQEKFLRKVWPGKVTAVLYAQPKQFPKGIVEKNKIGLRIPNYKILNILFKKINFPLTGTSANISGKESSTKITDILGQFENQEHQPNLILDAGNLKKSLPSTVVDLTNFKILRKGEFAKNKILEIIKENEK